MMTPTPNSGKNDRFDDEEDQEEIKQRGFQRRVNLEQRALSFAASGSEGLPKHRGGRFAYQLRDEQRLKNIAGVPQAIVKVIPGGGVGSRGELVAQLNYLSRDGTQELERGGGPGGYQIEGQDAIRDVATDWAMAWEDAASRDGRTARAKSKSFHLLVSYPEGTDTDMAQMAAEAFTDQLCQSGEYGDRWRYIAAWHTDRAHPHMHVVIDRLGASGRMMQIHPAKTINPKVLRALQVETAAEYGIALNDTPRVSRGHRDRGLSSPEWRAEQRGERRDRSPTRQVYAKTASSFADDAIGREANELKKLSDRYSKADTPERRHEAKELERAAFVLTSGGTLDDAPQTMVRNQPEERRDQEQRNETTGEEVTLDREPPKATSDFSGDQSSRANIDQDRLTERALEQQQGSHRLLTKAELWERLARKEKELVARRRRAEEREQSRSPTTKPSEPDPFPHDTDNVHERNNDDAVERHSNEQTPRGLNRNRPLSRQELSDLISREEKKLIDAKNRRLRETPSKQRDQGLDFGFD